MQHQNTHTDLNFPNSNYKRTSVHAYNYWAYKILLLLIIIAPQIMSQSNNNGRIGIDYMPHIGFHHPYVNSLRIPYGWNLTSTQVQAGLSPAADATYMQALGLTHLVSGYDATTKSSLFADKGLKIMDHNFSWQRDAIPQNYASESIYAEGNNLSEYPFEFGQYSPLPANMVFDNTNNFGFGNNSKSTNWAMSDEANTPHTGSALQVIDGSNYVTVIKADQKANQGTVLETMCWGAIHQFLMNKTSYRYNLKLRVKFEGIPVYNPNDPLTKKELLKIYFKQDNISTGKKISAPTGLEYAPYRVEDLSYSKDLPSGFTVLLDEIIYNNNAQVINNQWITYDINFTSDLVARSDLEFVIQTYNNCGSVSIDKMAIADTKYTELFTPDLQVAKKTQIKDAIYSIYSNYPSLPNFENIYVDEPYLLTAKIRKETQAILDTYFPKLNDVNGAYGPKWSYDYNLNYLLTKKSSGEQSVRYILDDYYAILHGYDWNDEVQTQKALLTKVLYQATEITPKGTNHTPGLYWGTLQAMKASRSFRPSSTGDIFTPNQYDIPYFCGLQEQGEVFIDQINGSVILNVDKTNRDAPRAPKPNEIYAQGNIAIAWGARGFMHYHVATRADWPNYEGCRTRPVYGLFDDATKVFHDKVTWTASDDPESLLKQSAGNTQVPNERYYAVQNLISMSKLIADSLMHTFWVGAESYDQRVTGAADEAHYQFYQKRLVESVKSIQPTTLLEDNQGQTYVELGYFKSALYSSSNRNLAVEKIDDDIKYIYVVNKRCVDTDPITGVTGKAKRIVKVKLDKTNFSPDYVNYTIIDISTGVKQYVSIDDEINLGEFLPGTGKLILVAPVVRIGGMIKRNELIKSSIDCIGSITVSQNATLTVNSTGALTIRNGAKLIGDPGSTISLSGTSTSKAKVDFESRNWTTHNGIDSKEGNILIYNGLISNAYSGVNSYRTAYTLISYTTIENCYYGISLSYSGDKAFIWNNTISNNNQRGIVVSVGSSPEILNNTISDNPLSNIYCEVGASPKLSNNKSNIGNVITNSQYGLYSINSNPVVNRIDATSYNTIKNNTLYNLYIQNNPVPDITYYAKYVYWGTTNPANFKVGSNGDYVDTTNSLKAQPTGSKSIMVNTRESHNAKSDLEIISGNYKSKSDSLKGMLNFAEELIYNKELTRAKRVIKDVISNSNETVVSKYAVEMLKQAYDTTETTVLKQELINIKRIPYLRNRANIELVSVDYANRETYLNEITKGNGKSLEDEDVLIGLYLQFKEMMIGETSQVDTVALTVIQQRMNTINPDYYLTQEVNTILGTAPKENTTLSKSTMGVVNKQIEEMEYKLSEAYPNPFNPSTKVEYTLPYRSKVTIRIYSLLGTLIKEMVNGELEKGQNSLQWNGDDDKNMKVSSGIYIMSINATSMENSTKSFNKSIKLMLVK